MGYEAACEAVGREMEGGRRPRERRPLEGARETVIDWVPGTVAGGRESEAPKARPARVGRDA